MFKTRPIQRPLSRLTLDNHREAHNCDEGFHGKVSVEDHEVRQRRIPELLGRVPDLLESKEDGILPS